jgi:hypothetical protein
MPMRTRLMSTEAKKARLRSACRYWVVAAVSLAAGGALEAEQVPVLTVLQRTVGAGMNPDEEDGGNRVPVFQRLTLDEKGERVALEWFEVADPLAALDDVKRRQRVTRKVILRMDKKEPLVWDLDPIGKKYRERKGDLNHMQRDRTVNEQQLIQAAKRYSSAERKAILEENFLNLDGSREVTATVEPGKTILGRKCERLVVTENGRTIIDAQITRDAPGVGSYFHLYRRLGVFSQEVLSEISGLEGVPLEARITVVTALPVRNLEVSVLDIAPGRAEEEFFEVPPGFTQEGALPDNLACEHCGVALPKNADRIGGKLRLDRWSYFCTQEHSRAFLDARRQQK